MGVGRWSRREFLAVMAGAGLGVWENMRTRSRPLASVRRVAAPPKATPALSRAPLVVEERNAIGGFDVVIAGGRVMDPESGYDRIANVGVKGGSVAAITQQALTGTRTIDARDLVVAPGFIDNLSYEPNTYGVWFKIADGVTTTLGMHGFDGAASPLLRQQTRYPVNFGGAFDDPWWRAKLGAQPYKSMSEDQIAGLVSLADRQLHDGWIGIDVEPEYDPGTSYAE